MKLTANDRLTVLKDGIEFEFEVAEEGGYLVSVPAYPSCISEGDSFEEALENIQDALLGCLAAAHELNLPIPPKLEPLLQQAQSAT